MSDSDHNLFSDSDSDDYLDDDAFFKKNAKYAGFLEEMNLESSSSQKRPRSGEESLEKEYEDNPNRKVLNDDDEYLPTIHEDGTIKVTKKPKIQKKEEEEEEPVEIKPTKPLTKSEKRKLKRKEKKEQEKREKELEEEKEDDEALLNDSNEMEVEEELTPEQKAKQHEKHYKDAMTEIAVNCELIMENPNKGVTKRHTEMCPLNIVVRYLQDKDVRVRILASLSLMKVFNDILPNYPIHLATKEEKETKVKKDVRTMRAYEESLMNFYSMYIKRLSKVIHNYKNEDKQECTVAVKCLCTILRNHYLFNLADTVCKTVVPYLFVKEDDLASIVVECLTDVFRGDSQGTISYSIVEQVARLIKNKNYAVHPRAIQLFLALPLKEVLTESDELGVRSKKKKKSKSELDKIMEESEGPDVEVYKAFQKDILQEVLLVYFHILKLPNNSSLIHVVLEGLAKYGHLLNSHIIMDLLSILKDVLNKTELPFESTLQCILASFKLIQIVSSIISIDESLFINKLYEIRFDLIHLQYQKYIPDYLECIDLCFLARKELLHERVAAFIKALMTLSLQVPTKYAMACISLARALLVRYPMYSSLVENEEGRCISGVYSFAGNAPEQVNAHAATLWELCLLNRVSDPSILVFVKELESSKPMRMDQNWREMLKKDYSHKIFTAEKLTKKKAIKEDPENEEDIDELVDAAFDE